jgi:hypothetical protein
MLKSKVQNLCKQYVALQNEINSLEAFSSTDVAKNAANLYSLGSRYREMYAIMVKLSFEGYVQMNQLESVIEEYKNGLNSFSGDNQQA